VPASVTSGSPAPGTIRIGIDLRRIDAPDSGQQRYLWRLGLWLADAGEEVHFLTVRPQLAGAAAPPPARLHRLDGLRRTELRRRIRALDLDVLLLNPERSAPFRGLHANVLRPAYGTERYLQKMRSFRSPLQTLIRRTARLAPSEILQRRWERHFYEDSDPAPEIIAVSEYMKREILTSYDVPADHVHVVYNGVDPDEFSPARRAALRERQRAAWSIPNDAVCLLFMGHNYRLKGLWQLMTAVAALRAERPDAELHLIVAGRGTGASQRRSARRRIAQLGLDGRVHLVGSVRPAMHAFAAADAFIHRSWHDSFGFVMLEAMAVGLPVVTTRFVGGAEIVDDGVSALLVDPRDDHAVTSAVRLLLDPDERRRIGEAAADIAAGRTETQNFRRVHVILHLAASRCAPVR
jgi:UDP-glucose:(heptosyl)LPS alpha-1,3-glucosyltransferase